MHTVRLLSIIGETNICTREEREAQNARIVELERRVMELWKVVESQQQVIEAMVWNAHEAVKPK